MDRQNHPLKEGEKKHWFTIALPWAVFPAHHPMTRQLCARLKTRPAGLEGPHAECRGCLPKPSILILLCTPRHSSLGFLDSSLVIRENLALNISEQET